MFSDRRTQPSLRIHVEDDTSFQPRPPVRTYSRSADGVSTGFKSPFSKSPLNWDELQNHSPNSLVRYGHQYHTQGQSHIKVSSIASTIHHCGDALTTCVNVCHDRQSSIHKEAERRDLAELRSRIGDLAFKLRTWAFEIGVDDNMSEATLKNIDAVALVVDVLERIQIRAEQLHQLCKDQPIQALLSTDGPRRIEDDLGADDLEDMDMSDEDDGGTDGEDSLFEFDQPANVETILQGLETQIRSLSRCSSRMRQLLFPDHPAFEERNKLLEMITQYFGTEQAVKRYRVDLSRYSGRAALEEAEAIARTLPDYDDDIVEIESNVTRTRTTGMLQPPNVDVRGGRKKRGKSDAAARPGPVSPQPRALPYRDDLERLDDFLGGSRG